MAMNKLEEKKMKKMKKPVILIRFYNENVTSPKKAAKKKV